MFLHTRAGDANLLALDIMQCGFVLPQVVVFSKNKTPSSVKTHSSVARKLLLGAVAGESRVLWFVGHIWDRLFLRRDEVAPKKNTFSEAAQLRAPLERGLSEAAQLVRRWREVVGGIASGCLF